MMLSTILPAAPFQYLPELYLVHLLFVIYTLNFERFEHEMKNI